MIPTGLIRSKFINIQKRAFYMNIPPPEPDKIKILLAIICFNYYLWYRRR